MAKNTGIQWTDHTWNPWQGCRKVSPGCANCYMYRDKHRFNQDPTTVIRSSKATFTAPLRWKEQAKVFVCSWSDFFIEDADGWRDEAWEVMCRTPHLTYLLLTKRPENMARRLDGSRRSLERICSETVPVEFDELEIEEREVLDKEISDLELSKRPINCLEKQGIRYVGQLIKMDKSEVSKIKGLGHRCLSEIALMLHNHGLCFNAPIIGWLPPNQRMQPRENIDGKQ